MTKHGKQAILAVVFITLKLFEMCDNYAGLFTNFSQIQKKSKDDFDFTKKLYFLFVFISNFFFLKEYNYTGMNTVFLPLAIRLLKQ